MNRRQRDLCMTNLDHWIEVWMLRNQGWEFKEIGELQGRSKQAGYQDWKRIKDKTINDLQELREEQNSLLTQGKE